MDPKFVEGVRGAKQLFDEGVFTHEEFTQEKQKLVTERDERQAASIRCPKIIEEQGGVRHFNAITGFTCQRQSYLVVRECNSLLCWFKSPPAHAPEPPLPLKCLTERAVREHSSFFQTLHYVVHLSFPSYCIGCTVSSRI